MSGQWITYTNKKDKEIMKLVQCYNWNPEITDLQERTDMATEQIERFEMSRWKRAIENEIKFELLRKEMRIEAGLDKPATFDTEIEKNKKYTYTCDISPTSEISSDDLLGFAREFYSALNCEKFEFALEQRGYNETNKFSGLHIHGNIITDESTTAQKINSITQDIRKKYKIKSNQIEVKPIKGFYGWTNRQNYIRGRKVGVDKDGVPKTEKVVYDNELRKHLNIQDIYNQDDVSLLDKFIKPHNDPTDSGVTKPISPLLKITSSNIKISMD